MDGRVAYAGTRLSKMEKHCFWIATSPQTATLLQSDNTCQEDAGSLATFTHRHTAVWPPNVWHAQHHCGTQAQRSRQ